MRTQFDAKVGDNTYVMTLLKAHSTKILNLFTKYLLESYHRKVDCRGESLEYEKLKLGEPVLFNPKRTGVKYSYKLFHFGVIDEIKPRRNSTYPRTIVVRTCERGKIIKRSVRPEDVMVLESKGGITPIESGEIKSLNV